MKTDQFVQPDPTESPAISRRSFIRGSASAAGALALSGGLSTLLPNVAQARSERSAASLGSVALQLGWTKNVAYGGSFLAEHFGYYAKHGVDVNILSGGPTVSGIPILVSGKALVAISDPTTVSEAIAKGAKLSIVAAGYQINPACILSLAKTPIKTPQDLIGKKIGVGAADDVEWQAFLKANKIDPSKVDTVPAGFDPSPVASGEWAGYLAFANNEPPQFEAEGIKPHVLLFQDYGLPSLNEVYVVTTETLKDSAQRQKAAAFLAGEIQGWTKFVSDPALAAKLTVDTYATGLGLKYKGEYLAALATRNVTVSPQTKAHGVLSFSAAQVNETIQTLARTDVKASKSLFDSSLLSDAHALIA